MKSQSSKLDKIRKSTKGLGRNMNQSSKSELDKTVDGILRIMSIKLTTGAIMTGKVPVGLL